VARICTQLYGPFVCVTCHRMVGVVYYLGDGGPYCNDCYSEMIVPEHLAPFVEKCPLCGHIDDSLYIQKAANREGTVPPDSDSCRSTLPPYAAWQRVYHD